MFWSGEKKCPTPLNFNIANETHTMFVISFANLWAEIYNLEKENYEVAIMTLSAFTPPIPQIDFDKDIENLDKKEEEDDDNKESIITSELLELNDLSHVKISSHEFEKDSDTNFHMDFVTCASNLRAMNYDIETIDKHRTRGIAGKIIPAIATTTAIVAGLVALELYKVVNGEEKIERYRDACFNLAIPFFAFTEPLKCESYKTIGKTFTSWDHYDSHDMKLGEFLDNFEEKTGLEIDMITYGSQMVYSFMLSQTKQDERKLLTIRENIERISGNVLTGDTIALTLNVVDPDDEDTEIEFPDVKLTI
jgi:ubiquitin-activating enzyme E1